MAKLKIEPIETPDKIINYWLKEKFVVFCIVFFGLSFNISMIFGPIYQGKLIDLIVGGGSLNDVILLSSTFVMLIGTIQLLRYFKRFYVRRFANSTSATMRLMIYNNIMHKSATELDDENAGNLMTRAISDVDLCVEGMRKFTTEVFDTGILMSSYFIAMCMYDVKITLICSVFIPVAMALAEKLKKLIYRFSQAYRQKSSEIANFTYDSIDNAMMYRANGVERINSNRYFEELSDLQSKAIKAHILENSMQPIYNVIAMLGVFGVIYLGGTNVIEGNWTLGVFVSYMAMFSALAVKASKAAKLFNSVQKSRVSWLRIKPYLTKYESKATNVSIDLQKTSLKIEKLNFCYPNSTSAIIKDINISAVKGEIIGITGPIASGKSTLGLALTGIYPYLGSVKIDGKELSSYSEFERSQMIAYLGHKPHLLSDTLYNNITLGSNQDISSVLSDVCFESDLASMHSGQNTLVGNNGVRLSGGQQSRIALARTLINKNKIIILDDPFSAVDMKTEEQIIENLRMNYKDSIIIIISHRLAIFTKINQIILLYANQIVDYGSHDTLIKKSKFYRTIFNLQSTEGGDDNA